MTSDKLSDILTEYGSTPYVSYKSLKWQLYNESIIIKNYNNLIEWLIEFQLPLKSY